VISLAPFRNIDSFNEAAPIVLEHFSVKGFEIFAFGRTPQSERPNFLAAEDERTTSPMEIHGRDVIAKHEPVDKRGKITSESLLVQVDERVYSLPNGSLKLDLFQYGNHVTWQQKIAVYGRRVTLEPSGSRWTIREISMAIIPTALSGHPLSLSASRS
jgi:hypothetical protein